MTRLRTTSAPSGDRADARRNRAAVVAAARKLYADGRADVVYEEVARRAGVGKATVYRHFPSREHLMAVVVDDVVETLRKRACVALERDDLGSAVAEWLLAYRDAGVRFGAISTHVAKQETADESPMDQACAPMRAAFVLLWTAAQRRGLVRADVTAGQVLRLVGVLPRDLCAEDDARAYLGIVLDGLGVCR